MIPILRSSLSVMLMIVALCCNPAEGPNRIWLDDQRVQKMENNLEKLNKIFQIVHERTGQSWIGFAIDGDTVFFKTCLDETGRYIPSNLCNYDSMLSETDRQALYDIIKELPQHGVIGAELSSALGTPLLILHTESSEYGYGRYFALSHSGDSMFDHRPYDVLDKRRSLYLLKDSE
jgi:hypothetical protein